MRKIFIILILLSTFYFLFSTASEAGVVSFPYFPSDENPILPCGVTSAGQEPCKNVCQFLELTQHITYFMLTLAVIILGPFFVILGGFLILTAGGSAGRLSKGKNTVLYAVIGMAIALAAWLIINTFLWLMAPEGQQRPAGVNWPTISCEENLAQYVPPPPPATTQPTLGSGSPAPAPPTGGPTPVQQAAQQLWGNRNSFLLLANHPSSGCPAQTTARAEIEDLSRGRLATLNCQGRCDCTQTGTLNENMLRSLNSLSQLLPNYRFTITEFGGGVHSQNSTHYQGRAVDFAVIGPAGSRTSQDWQLARDTLINIGGSRDVRCENNQGQRIANCDTGTTHIHAEY